jgi:hypothetical protein
VLTNTAFADRARMLIKRGYTPKVAVELALHETEIEHGSDPRIMERARADAEDFLLRARKASSEVSEVGSSDQTKWEGQTAIAFSGRTSYNFDRVESGTSTTSP